MAYIRHCTTTTATYARSFSVLLVFYLLGLLLINVIISFDKKNEEERKAKELEEGVVLEKEETAEETQNTADE